MQCGERGLIKIKAAKAHHTGVRCTFTLPAAAQCCKSSRGYSGRQDQRLKCSLFVAGMLGNVLLLMRALLAQEKQSLSGAII
jgi:hypothetical protein